MSSPRRTDELNAMAEALVQQHDYIGARDVYLQLLAMVSPAADDSESMLAAVAQRITLLKVAIRLDVLTGSIDVAVQRAEEAVSYTHLTLPTKRIV